MSDLDQLLAAGFAGNLTSLCTLQRLCRFSDLQAAEFCLVSPHTYRRWRHDRSPNPTAVRLLAVQAGYVPWTGWQGWLCRDRALWPPGWAQYAVSPGEITALPLLHQLIAEQRRELDAWRASDPSVHRIMRHR